MRIELKKENTMITTILFDLDGTLLPMDNDEFTKGYFGLLVRKLAPYGYDKQELVPAVWAGTAAMVKNNGKCSNYEVFWKTFAGVLGDRVYETKPVFDEFYSNEFNNAKAFCGADEKAAEAVKAAKKLGYRIALASNPLFPEEAQKARVKWAGVDPEAFEFIAAYENLSYCKPNPDYYRALAEQLEVRPEECLMVGNDVSEDMIAGDTGMNVFLLTDCLINKEQKDISVYKKGGFDKLTEYMEYLKG